MKKAGILTHYQVHNHGAILQMHALYQTLRALGFKPYVLTYKKDFSFLPPSLGEKYNISLKSAPYYAKYLLKKGIGKTLFNFRKYRTLNRFKKENYDFKPVFQSDMDYVVVGSDEVFSLEVGVNMVMYGHGVPCGNIISYAASFGQTDAAAVRARNCENLISSGLKSFKALCVRDEASFNTVKELASLEAEINFDPVLLYGFEKELRQKPIGKTTGKYLVVYAYDNNMNDEREVSLIKEYAAKNNLKVVSAGYYHKWADINLNINPLELLRVIKEAQAVVTDTFHGSVISALVNTPFAAFVRPINVNKMTFLLDSLGLSGRKMGDFSKLEEVLSRETDWNAVNGKISELRAKGLNYLKKNLTA